MADKYLSVVSSVNNGLIQGEGRPRHLRESFTLGCATRIIQEFGVRQKLNYPGKLLVIAEVRTYNYKESSVLGSSFLLG